MLGVCMICMAMFGSGVTTGMEPIAVVAKLTRRDQIPVRTVCCVAVAGAAMPGAAARRIATAAIPTTATATTVFGWFLSHSLVVEGGVVCLYPIGLTMQLIHRLAPAVNQILSSGQKYFALI